MAGDCNCQLSLHILKLPDTQDLQWYVDVYSGLFRYHSAVLHWLIKIEKKLWISDKYALPVCLNLFYGKMLC